MSQIGNTYVKNIVDYDFELKNENSALVHNKGTFVIKVFK